MQKREIRVNIMAVKNNHKTYWRGCLLQVLQKVKDQESKEAKIRINGRN